MGVLVVCDLGYRGDVTWEYGATGVMSASLSQPFRNCRAGALGAPVKLLAMAQRKGQIWLNVCIIKFSNAFWITQQTVCRQRYLEVFLIPYSRLLFCNAI